MTIRAVLLGVGLAVAIVACNATPFDVPAPRVACSFEPAECDRMISDAISALARADPQDRLTSPPVSIVVGDECPPNARCPAPVSWIVALRESNGRVHGVRVYRLGLGEPDLLGSVPAHILDQLP